MGVGARRGEDERYGQEAHRDGRRRNSSGAMPRTGAYRSLHLRPFLGAVWLLGPDAEAPVAPDSGSTSARTGPRFVQRPVELSPSY